MLTHKEVADLTATSRQTVNAVMNDLRARNIITFNRQRMLVRDMELLGAEVQPNIRSCGIAPAAASVSFHQSVTYL